MTNLEFYKDEIIENINEFNVIGLSITFVYKKYSNKEYSTLVDVINWLLTEHKEPIKLTQAEKHILESINKTFRYIARDRNETLNVFEYKPSKDNYGEWVLPLGAICTFCLFDKMFNFIKSEDKEPYLIEDILNNCEVIE
jgi:hypothetical protein